MTENNVRCPVCGGAAAGNALACPDCGFALAFVDRFAGEEARAAWQKAAEAARQALLSRLTAICAQKKVFKLTGGTLVFRSPRSGRLTLVQADGAHEQGADILDYDAAENPQRARAFLLSDGSVRIEGSDVGSARDLRGAKVKQIAVTAQCVYALNEEGKIDFRGQPCSLRVRDWQGVRAIAAAEGRLTGLTKEGRVLVQGEWGETATLWRDIIAVACADDATIACTAAGEARFSGRRQDERNVEGWSELAAVAVENFYAVGLRRDGRVCLGGRMVHRDLDQGRAEARNWENVCAIACSRSAIAALHPDGSVELAGNLPRCDKLLAAWNGFAQTARRELLAAARAEA